MRTGPARGSGKRGKEQILVEEAIENPDTMETTRNRWQVIKSLRAVETRCCGNHTPTARNISRTYANERANERARVNT